MKGTNSFLSMSILGMSPISPGTVGSLFSLPIFYLIYTIEPLLVLIVLPSTFYISNSLIQKNVTRPYDKSWIVIDEFLGMGISLLPLFYFQTFTPTYSFIAFFLFRLFDITKPSVIRQIDRQETPSSVLLDDVLAGLVSSLMLLIILLLR